MTYRIDLTREEQELVFSFQGILDATALADLRARTALSVAPVRLVFRAGTEVELACLSDLRALPVRSIVAESPFLSRWLSQE